MSKEKKVIYQEIKEYARCLRLPVLRNSAAAIVQDAALKELGYDEFLLNILRQEYDRLCENSRKNRIRLAGFPCERYLEDLIVDDLPPDAKQKLPQLKSLEFIKTGRNVILAGNPGTGKTHLSIGLGIRACCEGYKVLFTTIPLLITQLKETRSQQLLRAFGNKFAKYDLVIADELGYISFDKEGSELLFTHLSLRAGRKSTIITTNLSFDRWSEIFQDPVMTAAMVDRLTHKSYLINMNGGSYRLKETERWIKEGAFDHS
jgi:DNA replication protein DnaC